MVDKREYFRRWRAANRDKWADYYRRWRAANRDKSLGYLREYYRKNRDAVLASQKKHRGANRDARKAYEQLYYVRNRGFVLARKRQHYQSNREAMLSRMKRAHKQRSSNLSDGYIKSLLVNGTGLVFADVDIPELIEAKREQVQAERLLKRLNRFMEGAI